jgi:16S rRNA (cytosine1402-N4)-methyltransferase
VLALDLDDSALERGREALQSSGERLILAKANFKDIQQIAAIHHFLDAQGVLADIGVSSMMLDDPERGFSFMREGLLDMRMDREQALTAADLVNTYSEKEIADVLYMYGEERRSRPIARSIVRSRPLRTTFDLVRAVERVLGSPRLRTYPSRNSNLSGTAHCGECGVGKSPALLEFCSSLPAARRPSRCDQFSFS